MPLAFRCPGSIRRITSSLIKDDSTAKISMFGSLGDMFIQSLVPVCSKPCLMLCPVREGSSLAAKVGFGTPVIFGGSWVEDLGVLALGLGEYRPPE